MPLENLLALCELASYMGATTPFINTNVYEPSIENIALLSRSSASPDFLPYRAVVSSMISQYFLNKSMTTETAIHNLMEIECFADWANEFPLNLDLSGKASELDSHDLSLIGDLFPSTISLKITNSKITYLPEQFSKIEVFISNWATELDDIHVLDHSKHLRVLEISGGRVSSLPHGCTSLRKVALDNCRSITTLQPLDGSFSLQELTLNTIHVQSVPKDCKALEKVTVYGTFFETIDFSPLNGSCNLTTLHIENFMIPINFPTDCKMLSKVELHMLHMTSLSAFDDSPLLKQLILQSMSNLQYLPRNCPALEEIELLYCPNVKDLSSLDGSHTLRKLVFQDRIPRIRLPKDCPHLKIEIKTGEDVYK